MRPLIDNKKTALLPSAGNLLEKKYGPQGTAAREEFDAKAKAWYYSEVLKDARKASGLTQKQLAEKIGKRREYVAQLEKGETDMQLSTFLLMTNALGLKLALTY